MLEDMPIDMSERMLKDMSERMLEDILERMSKDMSKDMLERISEDMLEDMSERMSKDMSERMLKIVEYHDKQSSMMVAISFCICTLTLAQALVENSCAHRCTSCCTYILKPLL